MKSKKCKVQSVKLTRSFEVGFSIIEIILVIMIAASIIFLIANLPSSAKLVGTSKHESTAKEIAYKKIEDLRSLTFTNLANGTTAINDSRISSLPSGNGEVTVSDCPPQVCTSNEQVKEAKVIITWTEGGKEGKVEVSTFIAKDGLL